MLVPQNFAYATWSKENLPVYSVLVLKQSESDTVNRCVAPSFVEESARAVEVVEIIFVGLAPPEAHIGNLEVTPEVAGRVAVCLPVVFRPADGVRQPRHGAVLVKVLRVVRHELDRLGPERRDRGWGVVQVDGEAVRLVVVLHEPENIVVDVAEEVHLWLDPPVVLSGGEGRMFVEHAAIPTTHLVVGHLTGVLDFVLFQNLDGFLVDVVVDPRWFLPVLLRDDLVSALSLGGCACLLLELFGKGNIVEKGPWVVELVVPCPLEIVHGIKHALQFFVSY